MSAALGHSGATPVINQAVISTDQLLSALDQLVGAPGNSGQAEELVAAAERVAALMRGHGLLVETIVTPGAPVVIGRRAGRQPFTLLLYHHYDVPPPGSWRAWHHEPFQLAEREAILYGRGVADGKGPLVAQLSALTALIEAEGELPCGVVMVAEGEGLIGSPHLGAVVAEHHALLKADACLASGGEHDRGHDPERCSDDHKRYGFGLSEPDRRFGRDGSSDDQGAAPRPVAYDTGRHRYALGRTLDLAEDGDNVRPGRAESGHQREPITA